MKVSYFRCVSLELQLEQGGDIPCVPFRRAHHYALIPSKGLPSVVRVQRVEGCRGASNCFLKCPSASSWRCHAKDHGRPEASISCTLHSKGPFGVDSFELFGLERLFNMRNKCPSEGDIIQFGNAPLLSLTGRLSFWPALNFPMWTMRH